MEVEGMNVCVMLIGDVVVGWFIGGGEGYWWCDWYVCFKCGYGGCLYIM